MKREDVTVKPFADPIKTKSDAFLTRQRELDELNAHRALVKKQQRDAEAMAKQVAEAMKARIEHERNDALDGERYRAMEKWKALNADSIDTHDHSAGRAMTSAPIESVVGYVQFTCPQCARPLSAPRGSMVLCACGCSAKVQSADSFASGNAKPQPSQRMIYGERGVSWTDGKTAGEQVQVNHPEGRPLVRILGRTFMRDGAHGFEMTSENWTASVKHALAARERNAAPSAGWDPYPDGDV